MATSVIPALTDFVLAEARAGLTGVVVTDGIGVDQSKSEKRLAVGVSDPFSDTETEAAQSTEDWVGLSRARDEAGRITCTALCTDGAGNQKRARDAVFAIAGFLNDVLVNRPTTDPTSVQEAVPGVIAARIGQQRLTQDQEQDSGAVALLVFDVTFTARI